MLLGGLKMVQKRKINTKRRINYMVYLLVAVISVALWFVCVGIARFIDLLNKKKDWYIKISKKIEEDN